MQQNYRVLLIEDDMGTARAIQRSLALRGVAVDHLATVAAADWVQRTYPIGVFDIDLPDGDGVDLAERLLSQKVVRRAVFHTGCGDTVRLERASRLGVVCSKAASNGLLHALSATEAAELERSDVA